MKCFEFEQHQKKSKYHIELKEEQFHQNIALINDMRRVILYRYCKSKFKKFTQLKSIKMKLFILYQTLEKQSIKSLFRISGQQK
jgi:hypothetical protein